MLALRMIGQTLDMSVSEPNVLSRTSDLGPLAPLEDKALDLLTENTSDVEIEEGPRLIVEGVVHEAML